MSLKNTSKPFVAINERSRSENVSSNPKHGVQLEDPFTIQIPNYTIGLNNKNSVKEKTCATADLFI